MSPAAPASSPPRWRASIPIALGIFGIALSCSTACITSAVVGDMRDLAEDARRRSDSERTRQQIAQAIQPLLFPAVSPKTAADRIRVTGLAPNYTIEVAGDYSESSAASLIAQIGNLYSATVEFGTDLTVRVYNGTGPDRAVVSATVLTPLNVLRETLRAVLPPLISNHSADFQLEVTRTGANGVYRIAAEGQFTPESIKRFKDTLFKFCPATPRAPRFSVTLYGPPDGPGYRKIIEQFDTISWGTAGP